MAATGKSPTGAPVVCLGRRRVHHRSRLALARTPPLLRGKPPRPQPLEELAPRERLERMASRESPLVVEEARR